MLFQEERQRWEHLIAMVREKLVRPGAAVRAAWLYGSVARGEDTPRSDLDIALLVSSHKVADRVREDLMSLEDEQQVQFSVAALTPKDLAAISDNDPWWSGVVQDARILKGPAPTSNWQFAHFIGRCYVPNNFRCCGQRTSMALTGPRRLARHRRSEHGGANDRNQPLCSGRITVMPTVLVR